MDVAERKLDLFRRIDNLKGPELEKIYQKLLSIINESSDYRLTGAEKNAIDQALETSEQGQVYSTREVKEEAKKRHPNLRFK
jgi:hypothetical protein